MRILLLSPYDSLGHRRRREGLTTLHELQGLAVIEAVAAGCPPLAPDRLACSDIIAQRRPAEAPIRIASTRTERDPAPTFN